MPSTTLGGSRINLGSHGRIGVGRAGAKYAMSQFGARGGRTWRIEGIEVVANNINAELMKMKHKSEAGLVAAANHVLKDADEGTPPLVPEDTGELRKSTFVHSRKKPVTQDPFVLLGYNTDYAAAVHEMFVSASGKPINWKRPGSGPRFFEASLKRNVSNILRIVAYHAKI